MIRSLYCSNEMQNYISSKIQNPAKSLLLKEKYRLVDAIKAVKIVLSLKKLQEPTLDNIGDNPNHRILVQVKDDFFRHWTVPCYLLIFRYLFRLFLRFVIAKGSFDHLYEAMFHWFLKEMFKRGYKLPEHDNTSYPAWSKLPVDMKFKLKERIEYNYDFLQSRLANPNDPQTKENRRKQFVDRIVNFVEKEVIA